MSMLGEQIKELREAVGKFEGYQNGEISRMLREAADAIEGLRDSLNEVADRWADAQIDAEVYARENMLLKVYNDTRWHELFGTPERAARTLEAIPCGNLPCSKCPMFKPCCCDGVKEDEETFYDVLLEWLRGDAE